MAAAAARGFAVSALSGIVIGGMAHEAGASFGPGLLATVAGMSTIPFAVEAGMALMDKRKTQVVDTMDGIVASIVGGVIPAMLIGGLVAVVANKK